MSSLPARTKKIQSKLNALVLITIIHRFFTHSRAANSAVGGGISPKFELILEFMDVLLITCKNEEDPSEGARVLTTFFPLLSLWELFLDAQAQLALQFLVESDQNSSEILWLSSLPASMKKIQ